MGETSIGSGDQDRDRVLHNLGPVDWTGWEFTKQIISGGESGPRARPSHPDWHRATRDFCAAHGIAYFFKQWGRWAPGISGQSLAPDGSSPGPELWCAATTAWMSPVGKHRAGRLLDGRTHDEFPRAS